MPDIICTHCRGQYTSGCEYCNPFIMPTARYLPYTEETPSPYDREAPTALPPQSSNLPDPGEPPLTFDEIRKLRALLAKDEPLKYKGVEIVWGLT
jgi:hypothetical protein